MTSSALKISFEFFPPKTKKMAETLWQSVKRLEPLNPRFVSVTYGAGGTTRERTHNTLARINSDTSLSAAAHLTCVGATRDEVNRVAEEYWDVGIRHIVALRGDAPDDAVGYTPHPGGYEYASDLVAGLRDVGEFEISVAAYPEVHPESASISDDLDNLKRKLDAGATRAITQYFFEADVYLRFVEKVRKAGIDVEIVAGLLPVTNFKQVQKFSAICGAVVPRWMADLFEGLDNDPETRRLVAATTAAEQCRKLQAEGIDTFHFYTLNRADLSFAICHILGVRPESTKTLPETNV